MMDMERLIQEAQALGAFKAGVVDVASIPFEPDLRKACEANYCGNYGKNWTCPPDLGRVDDLIRRAREYTYALVFQTVSGIEDSYDWEGMVAAGVRHKEIAELILQKVEEVREGPMLQLSAGGCPICEVCAKKEDLPCRYPDKALGSLEAYGIHVAKMAKLCGMQYINGQNTVTYFGAFLFA